jgi:hypothetical protein
MSQIYKKSTPITTITTTPQKKGITVFSAKIK